MDNSEVVNTGIQETQETNPASAPSESNKWLKIVLLGVFGLIIAGGLVFAGYWYGKNSKLKTQSAKLNPPAGGQNLSPTETPAVISIPTSTSTPDPTANWQTYINSEYGYSIKYPIALKTQVVAAGAGTREAPPNARELYIYNPEMEESYMNRYINLEALGSELTRSNEWTRTQVRLGGKSATKLVNSNQTSDFDIYSSAKQQPRCA